MSTAIKVIRIIRDQLGINESQFIKESDGIVDDLGADSLDTITLVMALEEEFIIKIADEDAGKVETVSDVISLVQSTVEE